MEWFGENWFWLVILVVFVALHLFGHGGHAGHGGHGSRAGRGRHEPAGNDAKKPTAGHPH